MKEKKKEKQSKKKVIVIGAIVLGLIAIIGFSYAYINIRKEQSGENALTTGCFTIDFEEGNAISLRKAIPLTDSEGMALAPYDFTIRNSCGLPVTYQVNIEVIETSTIESENIKLAVDEKTPKKINEYEMIIPTLSDADEGYKLDEGLLLLGEETSYSIREWIDEEASIDIAGKTYKSKITIIFTQYKDSLTTDYAYTGEVQEFVVPRDGYYDVELWAGSGNGTIDFSNSFKGGYTKGTIYLEKDEIIYVYVGGYGSAAGAGGVSYAGWNGGGLGYYNNLHHPGRGGGGATDIRIAGTDLRDRIMVAGGAGGSGVYNSFPDTFVEGSNGGNLVSGSGGYNSESGYTTTVAAGVTQIAGNAFGKGGNGIACTTAGPTTNGGGAGGGGFYGGNGASVKCESGKSWISNSGSGGSSYISGYAGVNSVQETGGTAAQPLHTNNTLHYSGKYFVNGKMEAGVNNGNGKAEITYLGMNKPTKTNTKLNNVRYIKACASKINLETSNYAYFGELQAIKNGVNVAKGMSVIDTTTTAYTYSYGHVVDGDMNGYYMATQNVAGSKCMTVDLAQTYDLDEIAYWGLSPLYDRYYETIITNNVLSVSADKTNWTELHNYPNNTGPLETTNGSRYSAWD